MIDFSTVADLAESIARQYHEGQTYGDGQPYADYHLAKVVGIVKSMDSDPVVHAIAWLHDIIEDTRVTKAKLVTHFGNFIADQVETLTRPSDGESSWNETRYIDRLKKATPQAAVVKYADIIANMSNIGTKHGDTKMYSLAKLHELKIVVGRIL